MIPLDEYFRDGKFEQEMEYTNTSRFLNYRRYKEEKQKKLKQLRHLERLKKAQEAGEQHGPSAKMAGMMTKMGLVLSGPMLLDESGSTSTATAAGGAGGPAGATIGRSGH